MDGRYVRVLLLGVLVVRVLPSRDRAREASETLPIGLEYMWMYM